MTDILSNISKLRELPEDLHLFCPREGEDGSVYYDEDVVNFDEDEDKEAKEIRIAQIRIAEERKWIALESLEILAFHGEDAELPKQWVTDRLNNVMTSCDVCVRKFHQSRAEWKQRLQDKFENINDINEFLDVVDKQAKGRVQSGLDKAKAVLLKLEPKNRKVGSLPTESTYAFFESLSCDVIVRDDEFLQEYLDVPFQLVQTRRALKVQNFLPSMTRFVFSDVGIRRSWAVASWEKSQRTMLPIEFDWAVRDYLVEAMLRVQREYIQRANPNDMAKIATFWRGFRLIVPRLTRDIITDSLRGLQGDLYKLLIDHLPLQSEGFLDLVASMAILVESAPAAFWDAMDATRATSATIVEQILNSPTLSKILHATTAENVEQVQLLKEAFIWTSPYLQSIKPANLTEACRAFANMLFDRMQSNDFPPSARHFCFVSGLEVLRLCFKRMNDATTGVYFVGQPTVNGMLEILSSHIKIISSGLQGSGTAQAHDDQVIAFAMIQEAFTLEAQSLNVERRLITSKEPSPTETPPSRPIWTAVINTITSKNASFVIHLLMGGKLLIGLEPLFMKPGFDVPPPVRHFNDRFTLLSESITEVVDRLAEFDGEKIGKLFEDQYGARSIMCLLFSSTQETRSSSIELLKVISGQEERRDALQHILRSYYSNAVRGIREACNLIMRKKAFAPAPSLIKTCSDVIDVMCNAQDGILRSRELSSEEATLTTDLWKSVWDALLMIFRTTEDWSNLGYDKNLMQDFCRDTMQFADQLFDYCSVFLTAVKPQSADADDSEKGTAVLASLLELPSKTLSGITKWLRLRDEFLSTKSVTLITKLLTRLRKVSIAVDQGTVNYVHRVILGDVRAKLMPAQTAELQRALEIHLGHPIEKPEDPAKKKKQAQIASWAGASAKLIDEITPTSKVFQAQRDIRARQLAKQEEKKVASKTAQQEEFKAKRQAELEKRKKEKEAALAKLKKSRVGSEHTAEAGSGLEGLGVLGKDQAPKGEGLMHSSDESDQDDDYDEELFGPRTIKKPTGPKTNIINEIKIQGPVKKQKRVRNVNDMRARLAPDLSSLHKTILSWDYYHESDFPPNSRPETYSAVVKTFKTADDYKRTFEPLLLLEAWQSFVRAREENAPKPYEIRVVARSSVDMYHEVSSTMTHNENKNLSISEADIILLSQTGNPSPEDRYCLARVFRVVRKQAHVEVGYRVMPSNRLTPALVQNGTVFGTKIQSITPLEREYAALQGLLYYDLCSEILGGAPSPILNYNDTLLDNIINNYNVNKAQSKAVKSAIDNDGFTLIQGPPGSGKTKTIVAIVGAILSNSFQQHGTAVKLPGQQKGPDAALKKLLVCAPSNAAVDELVIRLKEGVKSLNGQERKLNVVRIGRSDAINASVQDVMLEHLVDKKLGTNNSGDKNKDSEANRALFAEHKQTSEQLRLARDQQDSGTLNPQEAAKLSEDIHALVRKKKALGTRIDNLKDLEKLASRDAGLNRRRAQEEILNNAHVICATLSGSGHDMFRNINIEFETVIVDEAAQCVEIGAIIPLKYGCTKCILVGDPKQLPPTVFSREATRFRYEQSLFVRMQMNRPKDVHLLDTQYRMHPEISLFPSRTFYDGQLLDGGDMAELRKRPWHTSSLLAPYRFFDVHGQHQAAPQGRSLINIAEIEVALQLYKRLTTDFADFAFKNKIGIITPYKSQLHELKARFSRVYGPTILDEVDFNTTDAFQGRECEVIIFSCVRASREGGIGFLQDIRRMNVGLTRAKSSLWVLGNSQSLVRGEFWKKLVDDAQARNRYTKGDVLSMLKRPSKAFPADPTSFQVSIQTKQVVPAKREADSIPMSRSGSGESGMSDTSTFKQVKQEAKQEVGQELDQYMELEPEVHGFMNDVKRKLSMQDEDVVMGQSESDAEPDVRLANDAATKAAGENHAKPAAEGLPNGSNAKMPQLGHPFGVGISQPKIRKRPKAPVDPFIKRQPPKKPRN